LRALAVANLKELDLYPWSGHSVLMGKVRNDWQERDYVLRQFSENEGRAIAAYHRFVEEGKDQGKRPELVGGVSRGSWSQVLSLRDNKNRGKHDDRILGGGDFVRDILREADKKLRRQVRPNERRTVIEQLIRKICREEEITEQELRMGGRRRKISKARARIAYYLSHEAGIPMAEIARQVGVCTSAVVKAIQNLESQKNK
jgi:hypothetical protein